MVSYEAGRPVVLRTNPGRRARPAGSGPKT